MKGSKVLIGSEPRGRIYEGTILGTPYPGTAMEIANGVAPVNGRFSYQALGINGGSTGDPRELIILLDDPLQGFIAGTPTTGAVGTAYVAGTRGFLYAPMQGDQLNVCVASQVGTGSADAYTIGERLIANFTTGQFIKESTSSIKAQVTSMEHIDIAADTPGMVWVEVA